MVGAVFAAHDKLVRETDKIDWSMVSGEQVNKDRRDHERGFGDLARDTHTHTEVLEVQQAFVLSHSNQTNCSSEKN